MRSVIVVSMVLLWCYDRGVVLMMVVVVVVGMIVVVDVLTVELWQLYCWC